MTGCVHILFHTVVRADAEEGRILGVFRTSTGASSALDALRSRPGFVDANDDAFDINEYRLEHDEWPEGFAWSWDQNRKPPEDWEVDVANLDDVPNVFLLQHRRITGQYEQMCMIGAYSSRESVVAAAKRASTKPGFAPLYDGLVALGMALDRVHWPNGFDVEEAHRRRLLTLEIT